MSISSPLEWEEELFPGTELPVQVARLRRGPDGRSANAVLLPAGWSRHQLVHYQGYEEILILEGDLTMSGVAYGPTDYGFVPARASRDGTFSRTGCLVIAFFTGPSLQLDGPSHLPTNEEPIHHRTGPSPLK
jgi:hypothetical protein